jgi:cyanate permease
MQGRRAVLRKAGIDIPDLWERASTAEIGAQLDANNRQAIERGVFGVPTFLRERPARHGPGAVAWRAIPKRTSLISMSEPGLCAKHVLCSWRFWSIALPFALALAAQVGLIVHLVSFLLPRLGATGAATALSLISLAAVGGRLALAGVIDRLHQRRGAAASFVSQAAGVALMVGFMQQPEALYAGCVLFGLSVGNVITFPALIVQREFPGAAFGMVIGLSTAIGQFTFALAPWLLGIVRDETGGYIAVLGLCSRERKPTTTCRYRSGR